ISKGIELFPKDFRFYRAWALLAEGQKNPEEAKRRLALGLEQVPSNVPLLEMQFHHQIHDRDFPGARITLKKLTAARVVQIDWSAYCGYLEGQLMMAQGDYLQASQRFQQVKARLGSPELESQAEQFLMECYNALGKSDQALNI